jgi:DNA-binding IclR family transcriptional regulator
MSIAMTDKKPRGPKVKPKKSSLPPINPLEEYHSFHSDHLMSANDGDRMFVNAIGKGMEILQAFQRLVSPLSNKQLVEITGYTKPTVSRLTHTLTKLGYLTIVNGKYELSPRVLTLAYPFLVNQRVREFAYPYLSEIAETGVYTLAIGIPEAASMVYILEASGPKQTALRVDVGARVEMGRSAMGRAYLAGLEEEARADTFVELRALYKTAWPDLRKRIEDSISSVEENGFCIVEREWRDDLRAVAVPLKGVDGRVKMAISCAAPTFATSTETLEKELGPRLLWIAREITSKLRGAAMPLR